MPYLDLYVCVYFHAIWLDPYLLMLYAWIHVLPCLCAMFLCVYMYVSMPICLDLCSHMLVRFDLCSLHALCHIPYACALHAIFLCLGLGYVCHAMCYCIPLSLCLSLLCFGLLVRTRFRPCGLCHRPYTLAHIRGFGSPFFACLCSFASMLYSRVSLSCSRLCHA